MFYPVESLKRGGRFYLCWVADSWPLRFATITHRQLWSQDVRKMCDDLMHFMTNESGRPDHRFSLRLSSQLMRGLVRIYQRKVTVFLSDLCMINANVTKHVNRRFNIPEVSEVQRISRPQPQQIPQIVLPEDAENEQRIEEIIQNSGNTVTNIQEITLREATIPEFQLPPNDGFGEENPDQALQMLADRTMEMMMVATEPSAHHSGLDLAGLDLTDKSQDRSRLVVDRQMERISEHDITLFRKSTGAESIPGRESGKEIPEIPEIPIPDLPILPQEQEPLEQEQIEIREQPVVAPAVERPAATQPEEIELEELESEPLAKRRRVRKLIIDKKIKIDTKTLRARIENPNVELRCEDSSDDIIEIRAPVDVYMRRPCHAGHSIHSNLSLDITRLFMRNLGVIYRSPRAERDFQEEIMHQQRPRSITMLERTDEVGEPPVPEMPQHPQEPIEANITYPDINLSEQANFSKDKLPELNVSKDNADISEMLTQKIDTLSQRKRSALTENFPSPKKQRSMGWVTLRKHQHDQTIAMETSVRAMEPDNQLAPEMEAEGDKENVPENMQETLRSKEPERSVTAMLQEAGLADIIQTYQAPVVEQELAVMSQREKDGSRKRGSEGSETPLGSLDRTKVSLGDSEQTTDSKRFIRDNWGTEGTMIKILRFIRQKSMPITVWRLISKGPVIPGYKRIIAARCFTSILKLKQHGFIAIKQCPDTLEIDDIDLGPKFD